MVVATKLLTAADLWKMPGDEPWEIWEGELRKVPGAGMEASDIGAAVVAALRPFVRAGNLGIVTMADGAFIMLREPDTVLVPDVAFTRWDRLPGRVRPSGYCPVPPDLAVEVISPWDKPGAMAKKRELYRRAGVPLLWYADPLRRRGAVYTDGELTADLGEGDELDGGEVLPGFRLTVAELFA